VIEDREFDEIRSGMTAFGPAPAVRFSAKIVAGERRQSGVARISFAPFLAMPLTADFTRCCDSRVSQLVTEKYSRFPSSKPRWMRAI
jgi:hypothetical protein